MASDPGTRRTSHSPTLARDRHRQTRVRAFSALAELADDCQALGLHGLPVWRALTTLEEALRDVPEDAEVAVTLGSVH